MAPPETDPLETHTIQSPTTVAYGTGAAARLADFVTEGDFDSTLIVTDPTLVETGAIDPVLDVLEPLAVEVEVMAVVTGEPKLSTPEIVADRLRAAGHDTVIGIGGGSCLDTAKLAGVLARHDQPIREMIGMGNVPGPGLPTALSATTAGSGSEVTHIGVFTDEEADGAKVVIYDAALFADLSIVDPELTRTLPPHVAAATGLDALTHAVEAYTTLVRTPYTDMLARRAIELIGEYLRPAVHQGPDNDAARAGMHYAAMLAGQAFVNSGLGAVHALTYPLGIEYDLGHGEANARLLPHVMAFNRPAERERFAAIASLLGPPDDGSIDDRSRAAVEAVISLSEEVGISPEIGTLGDLGDEEFARFADVAFEYSSHNVERNPRTMSQADAIDIYRAAAADED